MKIVLSHPTANANVRAVTKALAQEKILHAFYTCVALFKTSFFFRIFEFGPLKQFHRRSFDPILRHHTHTRPFREMGRLASQKLGWKSWIDHEKGVFCVDRIYQDLDSHVSKKIKNANAVYAYEDGALKSFRKARERGITCLYDLPTGYWRAHDTLLENERRDRPEWAMTFKCFKDSRKKLERKDKELALADAIFVASSFTKKTLELYKNSLAPVYLVPYGFPEVFKKRKYTEPVNRKLKFLFVGGLSQLKGLANVFEAVDVFDDKVELTVVGRKVVDGCEALEKGLTKHKWIPSLPHEKILALMRTQDVFIFPSLFEGYGLVIAEAMAQGTPVITTPRTCGADFIIDDENGWLVPPGKTSELIKKIEGILANPETIEEKGRAAMATAEELPMADYGKKMAETIKKVINPI